MRNYSSRHATYRGGGGLAALHVGNRSLWPVGQLRSLSLRHFPPCLCCDYVLRVLELTSCSDCSRGLYLFQDSPGYTVCRSRSGKLRHLGRGRPEFGGRPLRVCTPPPAGKHESGFSCVTWGPPEPSQLLWLKWPEPAAFLVWFAGEDSGASFFSPLEGNWEQLWCPQLPKVQRRWLAALEPIVRWRACSQSSV